MRNTCSSQLKKWRGTFTHTHILYIHIDTYSMFQSMNQILRLSLWIWIWIWKQPQMITFIDCWLLSQQSMNSSLVLNHVLTHVYKRLRPEDDTRVVYKHIFKNWKTSVECNFNRGGYRGGAFSPLTTRSLTLIHTYTHGITRAAPHDLGWMAPPPCQRGGPLVGWRAAVGTFRSEDDFKRSDAEVLQPAQSRLPSGLQRISFNYYDYCYCYYYQYWHNEVSKAEDSR